MNWGGFAAGFARTYNFDRLANYAMDSDLRAAREGAKQEAQSMRESAINDVINKGRSESIAANGLTGTPAEGVTRGSSNPTESIIQNPENATGATVTPITQGGATPPGMAAETTPASGNGAKSVAHEPTMPITPKSSGLPFVIGGKGYANEKEARAAAEKAAPSEMEFMEKALVPKMRQAYLDRGDIEMADKWGKWAEERDNKAAMKEWANAYRAAQMGNIEKAADHVFNLYKRYDDGITPLSKEVVKDKDGNITGFNVRLKTDATGEERTQFIGRKELTEMGLAALSPPQMFELQFKRQMEAEKVAAAAAAAEAKDSRTFVREMTKEHRADAREKAKDDRAIEKMVIEKGYRDTEPGELGKKIRDAKNSKLFTEDEIRAMAKGAASDVGKAPHPDTIRLQVYNKLADPNNRTKHQYMKDGKAVAVMFGQLPPEEQRRVIDEQTGAMLSIASPQSSTIPAAGGLPQASATPAKKGTPFWDTKTNSMIYR